MNGAQDLGGAHGFGPVTPEPDEPLFHARWEPRVMAMVVAAGALGEWNLDQSRYARESLAPADYLSFPYYRIWLAAFEKLLLARELVSAEELADGRMREKPETRRPALAPDQVDAALRRGGPVDRDVTREAGFAVGDRIATINEHPVSHTRLPRYARARTGTVEAVLGFHVFPDTNALGLGEDPQWLYRVRFTARELFGASRPENDAVTLDLWEPYLRAA